MAMEDIIKAAIEENWDYVDERIPEVCDIPENQIRALELLKDFDGNLRDLGASIIQKAHIPPKRFLRFREALAENVLSDPHKYAKYRAAFALAEHGPGISYRRRVLKVLREASSDEDVGEIARGYLERLG